LDVGSRGYFFAIPAAARCTALPIGWPQFAIVQSPETVETFIVELPPLEDATVLTWVMTLVPSGVVTQMTF
jgi:hypothetical protein